MPAGGELVVCGQYAVNYGGVTVGMMVGDEGLPTIRQVTKDKPLENTDRYGKTIIDFVRLGVDYYATYTCQEYRVGSLAAYYPYALYGRIGTIGRLGYNLGAALILTSIAGTTAFANPLSLTALFSVLAPNTDSKLIFGPEIRTVPITQILLPFTPSDGLGVGAFVTA